MKKVIRLTESDLINIVKKVLNEQSQTKPSFISKLYDRIKNKPLVKKVDSLYDPDLKKFISNVIKEFPNLKKNENLFLQKIKELEKNPEDFLSNQESNLNKLLNNQLQEQVAGVIALSFLALILLIFLVKKKNGFCKVGESATQKLEGLVGKTVNIYNDESEQMLYGKIKINTIYFEDCSNSSSRSSVKINSDLSVECLANPSRMDNKIYLSSKETVGRTTAGAKTVSTTTVIREDDKFNKKFTEHLQTLVGNFCQKPAADYSVTFEPSSQNIG